jgi:hypothetical protein
MVKFSKGAGILVILAFTACSDTVESQMQKYLEFYYPTSGKYFYQITFEWGDYTIDTGHKPDDDVHPDSEKYKGYVTARTSVEQTPEGEKLFNYLVTPQGEVWITEARDIPEFSERQEVTEEKTNYGTSTRTSTINSSMEPVIEHFLAHKNAWRKYGTITASGGQSTLKLLTKN